MTAPANNSIPGMALYVLCAWAVLCAGKAPLRLWDDEEEGERDA
jgi:hypothetical protein